MCHLFVDTFFEFSVVENFVYRARITVIRRLLQIYLKMARFIRLYESVTMTTCSIDDEILLLPVLFVILKMYTNTVLYTAA